MPERNSPSGIVGSVSEGNAEIPKEARGAFLINLAGCDSENEGVEVGFVGLNFVAVFHQKDSRSNDGNSLVAIDERMVACKSEEIGCGQFHQIITAISGLC